MWTDFLSRYGIVAILFLSTASAHAAPQLRTCTEMLECEQRLVIAVELASTDLRAALQAFITLYAEFPDPRLHYNIARMQHQLGQFQQAADSYLSYLDSGIESDPKRLLKAQTYRQQALQEARRQPVAETDPATTLPPKSTEVPAILGFGQQGSPAGLSANTEPMFNDHGSASSVPLDTVHAPVDSALRPLYKRGWFWPVVGGAIALVGLVVGLGISQAGTGTVGSSRSIPPNAMVLTPSFYTVLTPSFYTVLTPRF